MKNYEKPVVMVNEGLAEGVYAASGDCWTISCTKTQPWNNMWTMFEAGMVHSTGLEHISNTCRMVFEFTEEVGDAYISVPGTCTVSGKTVIVQRDSHANAYKSGDLVTFALGVKAAVNPESGSIECERSYATYCDKADNVQGGND